jgi:two-component system KDP operon response regulator KdpE
MKGCYASLVGQSVLLVEDDDELRRMFRMALSFAGYEVMEARDGYSALHFIDQHPPTAIVLDLGLPILSGHFVLADVAGQAATRHIPVIVVTGSGVEEPKGAACYLRKPVTPERLVNTVRACIASGAPPVC